ncbi:hypothetical protein K432DRAFT_410850 [Lepidopterella palustris CBS 459.81]|uniref:Uncharacterized protein n=1 Tax=Lepidopterella palustris CBS 459.81 TaxID=1314670 RepID=A0A8E2DX60_9PEZI|nr:hypothetical protein K432DRAFT_410850 [Lepidopterella palustris CBS 459.81]
MRIYEAGILALLPLVIVNAIPFPPTLHITPPIQQTGEDQGIFTGGSTPFDGPKLNFFNGSASDWWYFDAVSMDGSTHVTITFLIANLTSAENFVGEFTSINSVIFTAGFANGTTYQAFLPAGDAIVTTAGDGASGYWNGTGATFSASHDMSRFEIYVDLPVFNVTGTIILNSFTPPHSPCSIDIINASQGLTDVLGWVNPVPDSNTEVNIAIGDDLIVFNGTGYHDKNWATVPLAETAAFWYWGHVRLGPYSLIWWDLFLHDTTEINHGYLVTADSVISVGCYGLKVRPTGFNSTFPPSGHSGNPQGLHIEYEFGNGKVFVVDVTGRVEWEPLFQVGGYTRFVGQGTGGFQGGPVYSGPTLYEWMRYIP